MKYLILFLMNVSHLYDYVLRLFGARKPWMSDMSQIVPGLFLGGFFEVWPEGIDAVINLAEENDYRAPLGKILIQVGRPDFPPAQSPEELQVLVDWIGGMLARDRVLVCCDAGNHRSATVVIAYIMFTQHLSAERAQNVVQAKRVLAIPHPFQVQALRVYEAWLAKG